LRKNLQKRKKVFKEKLKEKGEELRQLQEEKIEAEIKQFVEEKKKEGKLLPKYEADVVTFMKELKKQGKTVNFSEGKEKNMYEWFKEFVDALPVQVPSGEVGKGEIIKDPIEKRVF